MALSLSSAALAFNAAAPAVRTSSRAVGVQMAEYVRRLPISPCCSRCAATLSPPLLWASAGLKVSRPSAVAAAASPSFPQTALWLVAAPTGTVERPRGRCLPLPPVLANEAANGAVTRTLALLCAGPWRVVRAGPRPRYAILQRAGGHGSGVRQPAAQAAVGVRWRVDRVLRLSGRAGRAGRVGSVQLLRAVQDLGQQPGCGVAA
eukprot:3993578-Prymnesium_polylepis.1